jgi:methylated-DNA-[protein]-cysteine S-methyltransferase
VTMTETTVRVKQDMLDDLVMRATAENLVDVAYTTMDSPLGALLLAATPVGLVRLTYAEDTDVDGVLRDLSLRVSPRVLESTARLQPVLRQLNSYFERGLKRFDMQLDWRLIGPFARRVLNYTSRIPYGRASTYGEVARDIGAPKASRAVGNALGANPIPIVIPCHRVLRSGGAIGGYGGGVGRKEWLLSLERSEGDPELRD